ncbi:alpha/beta hydrolase [Alteromonadaceae bacterium M269]|nr:alpha/beta hydrolase [Alteromonadaceae bacterium M269]
MSLNTSSDHAVTSNHTQEQIIELDGIEIAFDSFGNPNHPPMLLIMGLGMQMINWDDIFCQSLAAQGFWVIRFDNRDAGNSQKFNKKVGVLDLLIGQVLPKIGKPEYQLEDMAQDAIKLLDALDIKQAHIVGASMGGMIAQLLAIHFPERVKSLTSIMSTTGNRKLPRPKAKVMRAMLKPAPRDREQYLKHAINLWKLLHGTIIPFDEKRTIAVVSRSFDRQFYPRGIARQLHTILCAEDRTQLLKKVSVPTLVLHGEIDPLVPIEAGYATAKAIEHAQMEVIEGMGHNLPPPVWPTIVEHICQNASKAG